MKRKIIAGILAVTFFAVSLIGCGDGTNTEKENTNNADSNVAASNEAGTPAETTKESTAQAEGGGNEDLSGTLTFAIWDNNLNEFIEQNDMVGKFQEQYPNIEVEVEKIKDDSEYWNAMKMRASANQLPDIMFNKPFTLSRFKDYLIDLSGTTACANNELASGYAIDGKVLFR